MYKSILSFGLLVASIFSASASNITNDDLVFWVGEGPDSAMVVIDFLEPGGASSYAWGVAFTDSITGDEILDLLITNDGYISVDKGAFLNGITYKGHLSDRSSTYWGTWEGDDLASLSMNSGVSDKIGNSQVLGFSYTDFNPAVAPSSPIPAEQGFFNEDVAYWVGEGPDSAVVIIDFLEPSSESSYAWGVAFTDSITGDAILDLLVANDPAISVDKGAFLNSIEYNEHLSDRPSTYWGTWAGDDLASLSMNGGITAKIGDHQIFGFSYTDFAPAVAPELPLAAERGVYFSDVDFWIGSGLDSALVVVDFLDPADESSYVWGVAFTDSITGDEILDYINWHDKDFEVDKGAFLNSIEYKNQASDRAGTYWGTWEGNDLASLAMNSGITDKIGDHQIFGFSYTDFAPAVSPSTPDAAIQEFFYPKAGEEGSLAIHQDSSIIIQLASVVSLERGYQDIALPDSGFVTFGEEANTLVKGSYLSLGDGGNVVLQVSGYEIVDGPGPDFAVFENGFEYDGSEFLELAFVEVSANGIDYVRFPAVSLTQSFEQIGGFDGFEGKYLYNFAGRELGQYGTPFDLAELGLDKIQFIRLVDVVGAIDGAHVSFDSRGNAVNDPYSTQFSSGGFDLDFVAAINSQPISTGIEKSALFSGTQVYPTITPDYVTIETDLTDLSVVISNSNGIRVGYQDIESFDGTIDLSKYNKGLYTVTLISEREVYSVKVVKN